MGTYIYIHTCNMVDWYHNYMNSKIICHAIFHMIWCFTYMYHICTCMADSTDNDDETDDMWNYVWYTMYGSVRTWGISQFSAILIWDLISNCWMLGFLGFLCSDIPTWRMNGNKPIWANQIVANYGANKLRGSSLTHAQWQDAESFMKRLHEQLRNLIYRWVYK